MLHLLKQTVNPPISLRECIGHWHRISLALREPPRKRQSRAYVTDKAIASYLSA